MKRIVLAALIVSAISCGHTPTAPGYGARGTHLQFGRVVQGLLNAPDTALYYIDVHAGDLVAGYAGSLDSTVVLQFADSGADLSNGHAVNHSSTPGTNALFTYLVPSTGALTIAAVRPAPTSRAVEGQSIFTLEVLLVNTDPEHLKPAFNVGQAISGESIDSIGDIDVFTFNGTAGKQVLGYLRASGATAGGVQMQIYQNSPDSLLALATSQTPDSVLENNATSAFTLPATGTYHVRFQEMDGTSYVGPYQFEIYQVDSAPESAPATVNPGDTINGESIDHLGDIDVFTVHAKAGATYNLFAQTLGSVKNVEEFDVLDVPGNISLTVAPGGALTDGPGSGVFAAPANGQFRVQVKNIAHASGPYRFFVYPIDTLNEIAPAAFNLGDSVTTETIQLPGDVDNFTMNVSRASSASLCVTYGAVALRVPALTYQTPYSQCAVGLPVVPGPYRAIASDPPGGSYRGRYTIKSWAYDSTPEHISPVITLGDTVKGESIDAPGDLDQFTVTVRAHTLLTVTMSGTPSTLQPYWTLYKISRWNSISGGGVGTSGPIELDSAGTYTFEVTGTYPGSYSFVLTPYPTAPEHHAATVPLGSTITGESIDFPYDVDQFTITGTPGTIGLFSINNLLPPPINVDILSPDSSTVLTQLQNTAVFAPIYSDRFTIPASGNVLLRVYGGGVGYTGPYSIGTSVINPAPEHVSATTAIGDTVTGESIDYIGDLDEFTFSGTAGQKINVYFQTPTGNTDLILQLLAPDGTALGRVQSFNADPLANQSTGTVTLPATGTYTISVTGSGLVSVGNGSYATGPYVFAILPSS